MRKFLAIALTLASVGFAASTAEAKAANPSNSFATVSAAKAAPAAAQIWRGRRGRTRVVTRSRLVRVGRRVYRETYQIRYLPNGRTQTRLVSRVRVR
jgi:hypothetical protein